PAATAAPPSLSRSRRLMVVGVTGSAMVSPSCKVISRPDSMSAALIDQAGDFRVRYDPRHMANRWVALAIVFVTRTSMGFQFQAVAAVAPLMVADLQLTWVQLGSLIGLYMLPGAVFALPGGVLGQRFGERRMVVGSLALMVAGGLVTAAAHGFITAAAGRLLSGVGAVLMNILLAKMVADWFADREM